MDGPEEGEGEGERAEVPESCLDERVQVREASPRGVYILVDLSQVSTQVDFVCLQTCSLYP